MVESVVAGLGGLLLIVNAEHVAREVGRHRSVPALGILAAAVGRPAVLRLFGAAWLAVAAFWAWG